MGVLRYKLLRDLWEHKFRTLQVVLIIALGAAAIGMILSTRNLVIAGMMDIWQEMNSSMVQIFVGPPVSDAQMAVLRRTEGVVMMEGASSATIEWRFNPQEEWRTGTLSARPDYDHQLMNRYELQEGGWPDGEELAIGLGDDKFFGMPKSGYIYLRINESDRLIETGGGVIYNPLSNPASQGGNAQFFASQSFFEELTGSDGYTNIFVRAAEFNEEKIADLAEQIQTKLEKQGHGTGRWVTDPNKHFFQDQLDGMFFLLGVLGALALAMGLLLVYNTINALIAQQVSQIGIMKAIGGRTGQMLRLYLTSILIYSLLALVIAIPLGVFGGWGMASWLVSSFGADPGTFEYSVDAIIVIAAICLAAPFLAALIPIFKGAHITVREAINTYGLNVNTGLVEKMFTRVRFISRLVVLTVSNTFRSKGRLILMQITLVLSGLIFMIVFSVRDSVVYTIKDVMFTILGADVTMIFDQPQRINYAEELTLTYPGVTGVEIWGLSNSTIRPQGAAETDDDEDVLLFGVPLPTRLYGYQLRGGRWLEPGEDAAIVLNMKLAEDVGVGLGDWVTVQYGEKNQRDWQVVGLIFDPLLSTAAIVAREPLLHDLGEVGRGQALFIEAAQPGLAFEVELAKGLRRFYDQHGMKIVAQRGIFGIGGDSTTETATTFINQFNFLVVLLSVMAVIIGAVGSVALSGALSLSVMERGREIGVMRAIGASSWTIARLFIGEGLLLGWLSWLIALPLSLPAGQLMVQQLGLAFRLSLVYNYTPLGAIVWFGVISFLSILASWLPARGATRISVRESLAYQ